jgi:protein-disulfide isomerase
MRTSRFVTIVVVGLLGLALAVIPGRSAQGHPTVARAADLAVFDIAGKPFLGDGNAKLALIEFTDFQCPFCFRHLTQTFPQIDRDYIQTGKLRYIVRDFPLANHPQAFKAAEASHCAADQGKYWQMHQKLFSNQKALSLSAMVQFAGSLDMRTPAFEQCLRQGKYEMRVRQDFVEGLAAGVRGTPAFFLGVVDSAGRTVRSQSMITGAQPYSRFKAALDRLLAQN